MPDLADNRPDLGSINARQGVFYEKIGGESRCASFLA